jgi:hypothetical protein
MPRCYFLALSHSSALDKGSNNLSVFHLIEQFKVEAPPETTALSDASDAGAGDSERVIMAEVHVYWQAEPAEIGSSIEFRVVRRAEGKPDEAGQAFPLQLTHRRFRFRTVGFVLPSMEGAWELRVEWRRAGETVWQRDPAWWPLDLELNSPEASEKATETLSSVS